jgi:hypothetical protein
MPKKKRAGGNIAEISTTSPDELRESNFMRWRRDRSGAQALGETPFFAA